ncbi:enoyl-CoA hydratase-related protein [Terasakiella pusilla]|uniref:enoyl-CoA hydratase-related protein n=1 Tax=Terasakiella pusilla TaxID=64973 RepID=UPI00048DB10C|nr:enoyl-CoA hydratase-related protein [Terasakiella pusilla]
MDFSYIQLTRDDHIARLHLNRPDVMNALNKDMLGEIATAFAALENDDTVKCLIIQGNGRGFCTGQDLEERRVPDGQDMPDLGDSLAQRYNPIITAIRNFPFPVLCALNGPAVGAGAGIALACDVVVAAKTASLIFPFNRLGLIPDSGLTWSLPRLAGFARASASILLCDPIPAANAKEWGLIWDVVEPDELNNTINGLAQKLISQPSLGMALAKQALNHSLSNDITQQLALESSLQRTAGAHPDYKQRVLAFLNRKGG